MRKINLRAISRKKHHHEQLFTIVFTAKCKQNLTIVIMSRVCIKIGYRITEKELKCLLFYLANEDILKKVTFKIYILSWGSF